jgi:hypothetical protein
LTQWSISLYIYCSRQKLKDWSNIDLKKKVKNKAHVEASICEAYIVEEISTFISYYFEPHLRTRINCVPRHDDGGEVPSSGNLSIFSNTGRPTPKHAVRGRYLSEIDSNKHTTMFYLTVMS